MNVNVLSSASKKYMSMEEFVNEDCLVFLGLSLLPFELNAPKAVAA